MTLSPPRMQDHVRARLMETADRFDMNVTVADVDRLAQAAAGAALESAPARLENRPSVTELHWREQQMLVGIGRSLTNARIAAGLGLGEDTVKTYVATLLAKLGAHDRVHAVLIALDRGFLRLDQLLEPGGPAPESTSSGSAGHGTLAGYEKHLSDATVPCRRCHAAHAYRPPSRERQSRQPPVATVFVNSTCPDGDHLVWVGPQSTVSINGRKHTLARAAWLAFRDRVPQGRVQADCGMRGCVEPTHLTDANDRARLGVALA